MKKFLNIYLTLVVASVSIYSCKQSESKPAVNECDSVVTTKSDSLGFRISAPDTITISLKDSEATYHGTVLATVKTKESKAAVEAVKVSNLPNRFEASRIIGRSIDSVVYCSTGDRKGHGAALVLNIDREGNESNFVVYWKGKEFNAFLNPRPLHPDCFVIRWQS